MSKTIAFPPHIIDKKDTRQIMLDVIVALIPAIACSLIVYGLKAIVSYVAGMVFCMFFEWLFCKIQKVKSTINDLSATLTGILLVMCIPPYMPLWMIAVGSFIAIVIGKMVFGGLGQNPFNPALLGRTALLISFPALMVSWSFTSLPLFTIDTLSGATTLGAAKNDILLGKVLPMLSFSFNDMLFLKSGTSLGETSCMAIILGGVYLIIRKVISWHIPIIYILTVFIFGGVLWFFNQGLILDPVTQVMSGGLMLGAFFMATDYASSPMFLKAKIIFAFGCGLLTVLIRFYGAYPEGVAFAILIMNAFAPLLDKVFKPVTFGRSV